jgi:hypothetical protein
MYRITLTLFAISAIGWGPEIALAQSSGARTTGASVALTAPTAWRIVPDQSIVAVVTHRKGFAGSLAHNHLIAAAPGAVELDFDPTAPAEAAFSVRTPAVDLMVDDDSLEARALPRLVELGILDEFHDISEKDRAEVRKNMLDSGQLNAADFPEVSARLLWSASAGQEPMGTAVLPVGFDWRAGVELSAAGGTAEVPTVARYAMEGDTLVIEAFGETRFTALGIEPYSRFLGSVKNDDVMHLYLRLRAVPAAG